MRTFTRELNNKEETLNELFGRVGIAGGLSHRSLDPGGLSFPYGAGTLFLYGGYIDIPEAELVIIASDTNYIELQAADPYSVSTNVTGFTPGRVPLYEVDTNSTDITAVRDRRQAINIAQPGANQTQKIDYAASITPDAHAGRYVEVEELGGPMQINAPTSAPDSGGGNSGIAYELIFMFQQDGTGSRVITWDSVFKKDADSAGGIDEVGTTRFVYDRGVWVQLGGAMQWL